MRKTLTTWLLVGTLAFTGSVMAFAGERDHKPEQGKSADGVEHSPAAIPPTSQPADEWENVLRQAALAAKRVDDAKASCLAKLAERHEYKDALTEAKAKKAELDDARTSDSSQDRLVASSAYNKARKTVADLEAKAINTDQELAAAIKLSTDAEAAVTKTTEKKAAQRRADVEKDYNDLIKKAIRDHVVVIGMTLEQASEATGSVALLKGDSADGKEYEWDLFSGNRKTGHYFLGLVVDGKVVAFRLVD